MLFAASYQWTATPGQPSGPARLTGARHIWHRRGNPRARGLRYLAPFPAHRMICVSRFATPSPGFLSANRKSSVVFSPFDTALRDTETGIPAPPDQPAEFAARIEQLMRDSGHVHSMPKRARDEARARFGIYRHVQAIAAIYRESLA
ncbi:hypothetical protein IAG41_03150 [Sphingomonas sp. JC676]|uniref:glycosyltransferase n=1 Tax=Sphingomonas sp. JC676 TaxID=2768065 RepID=UPI001657DA5F|nr:hypothetical protein [Sphingomonas sp. JC676]MBC9031380.1 hypothetical protein [Sphingomonas sp. JC676]